MSNEVELISFCKDYGKFSACKNINFYAGKNSITGILGPNGAGKTSVLKAICGLHYQTSGTIKICGTEETDEFKKLTAFVPEVPELDSSLTVKENLFFEAEISGQKKTEAELTIKNVAEICGLEEVFSKKISNLSKGFKQRTSLAKAICKLPKILVLDEFSAGLDPAQIASFRKKLKELSSSMTIIFSTHHIEEAVSLCNRIYIIANGEVAACGTEKEITKKFNCKNLEKAFICATEKSQ